MSGTELAKKPAARKPACDDEVSLGSSFWDSDDPVRPTVYSRCVGDVDTEVEMDERKGPVEQEETEFAGWTQREIENFRMMEGL